MFCKVKISSQLDIIIYAIETEKFSIMFTVKRLCETNIFSNKDI